MLLGINKKTNKNHKAINTIIMTVKKRICYMERLKCSLPNNIKSLIDIRINTEKYIELSWCARRTYDTLLVIDEGCKT